VPTPGMRCPWSWLSALRCSTRLCLAPLLAATASLASPPTPEPGSLSPVVAYDDLLGVAALGPDDVVTVGSWGRLARSRDGGASWQIRSVEAPATLLDVDFADDDHGWIVGESGLVVATSDGGRTWHRQASPTTLHLFAVQALDALHAVAVGEQGTVLRTGDGGATWLDASLGEDLILNDVLFHNGTEGWAVGEFGTILHTLDGGLSWTPRESIAGAPEDVYLYAVRFRDGVGLAVGLGGTLLESRDDGRTWTALASRTRNHLFALTLTPAAAVAVGDQVVIRRITDAGASPPRQMPEASLWLRDVAFAGSTGYAVGANAQVLRSSDAGATWVDVSPVRLLRDHAAPAASP
jgi:photosystem II stability/assembly factor-like uncharacterized protein